MTLMIWTIIEPGAYLIAACLPTLRPLVIKARETSRVSLSFSGKRGSDASAVQEVAPPRSSMIERNTTFSVESSPMEDVGQSIISDYKTDKDMV